MKRSREETAVAGRGVLLFMWLVFPLAGAAAGWLLQAGAGRVADLPWAPMRGPFELIDSFSDAEPQATLGSLAAGALLGAGLALLGTLDHLTVAVGPAGVVLRRGPRTDEFPRAAVHLAFPDGRELVLLGPDTGELAREKHDLGKDALAAAFTAHGYPWADADPHREEFRRWVEGASGLPEAAEALLRARAKALAKGDGGDARELRGELARLGIVVRDRKKRQYWRAAGGRLTEDG